MFINLKPPFVKQKLHTAVFFGIKSINKKARAVFTEQRGQKLKFSEF